MAAPWHLSDCHPAFVPLRRPGFPNFNSEALLWWVLFVCLLNMLDWFSLHRHIWFPLSFYCFLLLRCNVWKKTLITYLCLPSWLLFIWVSSCRHSWNLGNPYTPCNQVLGHTWNKASKYLEPLFSFFGLVVGHPWAHVPCTEQFTSGTFFTYHSSNAQQNVKTQISLVWFQDI